MMPPPTRPSAAGRASMRQGQRASSTRPQSRLQPSRPATATATSRSSAPSPAASVSSDATTTAAGMKRKERDFESEFSEETNINVVVRCRGRSAREVEENSAVVVGTDGAMGKQVELSMGPNALSNKSYAFDRVFSQAADQSMVFDDVVKPILSEVSLFQALWVLAHAHNRRCLLASIALYSHTARLVQARPTLCPVT